MFKRDDWGYALRLLLGPHRRDLMRWAESRLDPDYLLAKPSPWLSFPALRWIDRFLQNRPQPRVFEYGSGGSTLFWLARQCHCTSIEHDADWHARLKGLAPADARLDLRCVQSEIAQAAGPYDPSRPELYQSSTSRDRNFGSYVRQIDEFPDGSFDVVLVDGRARPSCLMHARSKVRAGGILILDNADREHYLRNTLAKLGDFERHVLRGAAPTVSFMVQTDVFARRD